MSNDVSAINSKLANDIASNPLPTRAEKRFVSKPVNVMGVDPSAFKITGALKPYTDFVSVRIPGRGRDNQGNYIPTQPAIFKFLVNPAEVSIPHQTMNAQSFTRGGWQFGVAGDGPINISLSGKTPGRYFAGGLTDKYAPYTVSFRNLEALEILVENNGYWFEGEQVNEGPLAATSYNASAHRLIKMHQDVELYFGDFIWVGMFEDMTIRESAETPYLSDFSLTFVAWKERFNNQTPYLNANTNNLERGHYPKVIHNKPKTKVTVTFESTSGQALDLSGDSTPTSPNPINSAIQNPSSGVFQQ